MKVKELIKILNQLPEDSIVHIQLHDNSVFESQGIVKSVDYHNMNHYIDNKHNIHKLKGKIVFITN